MMERAVSQLERLMPRAAALSLGVCLLYATASLTLSMLNKALLSRCVRARSRRMLLGVRRGSQPRGPLSRARAGPPPLAPSSLPVQLRL